MLKFVLRGNGGSIQTILRKSQVNLTLTRNLQGLTVGVPKEVLEGEHRVALTPTNVGKLLKAGASINIESSAGDLSGFTDGMYKDAGAKIVTSSDVWKSDVVAKVFH